MWVFWILNLFYMTIGHSLISFADCTRSVRNDGTNGTRAISFLWNEWQDMKRLNFFMHI